MSKESLAPALPPVGRTGFGDLLATVLLIESDPLQAILRKNVLGRQFSDVVRVNDAAEALCLVEQPDLAAHLGLVICCHDMQGLGSWEFVRELHARLPQLPVLVLGGTNQEGQPYAGEQVRFLAKPFEGHQLLAAACALAPLTALRMA